MPTFASISQTCLGLTAVWFAAIAAAARFVRDDEAGFADAPRMTVAI